MIIHRDFGYVYGGRLSNAKCADWVNNMHKYSRLLFGEPVISNKGSATLSSSLLMSLKRFNHRIIQIIFTFDLPSYKNHDFYIDLLSELPETLCSVFHKKFQNFLYYQESTRYRSFFAFK